MRASYKRAKMLPAPEGQLAMRPTSQQTRNSVLAAIPHAPDELFTMKGFIRSAEEIAEMAKAAHPTVVDPSSAYGCVDWYLYPDSRPESAAA
jgi:hypothetical protein